ncbi:DUF2334 domain-containing protein [uncultured Mycolicibacterium sp.]|uniref:DUF2334 domain-containing protein n=1 Tax=uncultured Mycolicibacterium sp. TaxID=2320817 RepID=UPI0026348A5A|nr:DUF2334 domain-containing protein [uncultured Mycolicibacterium sp.]
MAGLLLVSVSHIDANTRDDVADLCAELDTRQVPVSFLVTPRLPHGYRLDRDPDTADWLVQRREGGDAIVLNGFDGTTRWGRTEFAVLGAHEASLRLLAADRVMEHLGLRTRLFAAPGPVSHGTLLGLPRNGFRLLINRYEIRDLLGDTSLRVRVPGATAARFGQLWWCRAVVSAAGRRARRGDVMRLRVSARQLARPGVRQAVLDAVDLALMHGAVPDVYRWQPRRPALTDVA